MQSVVQVISRASVIFYFSISFLHIQMTRHGRPVRGPTFGPAESVPNPPGGGAAEICRELSRCRGGPADTVWLLGVSLHSAASPPAATWPREQIWPHSFHIYSKAPGPAPPPPLLPSDMSCQRCQTAGVAVMWVPRRLH